MKKALSFILMLFFVFPIVAIDELYDQISHDWQEIHAPVCEEVKKTVNCVSSRASSLLKDAEEVSNVYPGVTEKVTETFASDDFNQDNILLEPTNSVDMVQVYQEAKKYVEPVASSVMQTCKEIKENAGPAKDAFVRVIYRAFKAAEEKADAYPEVMEKVTETFSSDAFTRDNILFEPTDHVDMAQVYTAAKKYVEPVANSFASIVSRALTVVKQTANNNPEIMKKITEAFTSGDFENDDILSSGSENNCVHSSLNFVQTSKLVSENSAKIPTMFTEVKEVINPRVEGLSPVTQIEEGLGSRLFGFCAHKLQQVTGLATGAFESVKSFDKDAFVESCKQEPVKPFVIVGGALLGSYITYQLGKVVHKKLFS